MKKYVRKACITAALLCFFTTILHSQTTRILRGGKELSSSMVNHIMQDSKGIVWISSDNGLNRYDGAKNTVIHGIQNNDSRFEQVMEDSKGRKWISGAGRIFLYDDNTAEVKVLQALDGKGKPILPSSKGFVEDKEGNIYAYTQGNGIFKMQEEKGEMRFRQVTDILPWAYIYDMCKDKNGILWAGTNKGIVRIDGKKSEIVTRNITTKQIYTICVDPHGNVWGGSDVGGLFGYNVKTKQAFSVAELENTPIISLLSKRNDELLAGSNGRGIFSVKLFSHQASPFMFVSPEFDTKKLNVHALMDDHKGNLWIGCFQKGITILRREEKTFDYIGYHSTAKDWIGDGCVMAMAFDKNQGLWLAADGDGLYYIKDGKSSHYAAHVNNIPKTIMSLKADNNGRLWIGSWIEGLWVMELATQRMTQINIPTKDKSTASVFSIVDDGKGKMWIATMGNGVFAVDANTLDATATPMAFNDGLNNLKDNVIPNRWVNALCMGGNGILYVATFNGLGAINTKTGSCTSTFGGKNQLLPDLTIFTLKYDGKGKLWIGTSKGLMCLNTKDNSIESFADKSDVAGNSVQGIEIDKEGTIWFSTNVGISSYNEKTKAFNNYFAGNGMYANEFSKNAIAKAMDGRIYFGGTEGVTFFNPANVSSKHEKPLILISDLYVKGESVTPATKLDGRNVIDAIISEAKEITLPYSNRDFVLELSSLDFVEPENTLFEYCLDNGEWITLPMTNSTISFSALSVGTHKIQVRSKEWETYSDIKEITVVICNPWFFSWWACLLYIIILGAIAYVAYRYNREKRKAERADAFIKQQEEISEARLQSFMNISHEIRTPMTLIISPLQRLLATDNDPKRQSAYQLMNRNAQRIHQLVNQLLDVRKIDKGQMKLYFKEVEMVKYVEGLVKSMNELCEVKKINLSFECNEERLNAWIDPLNFDKIIYNLLSNAIKYSPEKSNISVVLATIDPGHYTITVTDEGKGLAEDSIDHVFDRFYQQHNATNNSVQGSGIGLNLTRSLTLMHYGEITAANNNNGPGCHFIVTLPLGREHIKEEEIDNVEPALEIKETKQEPAVEKDVIIAEPETPKRPKSNKRMLIVEDDDEICLYLKEELKKDFLITTCENGKKALEEIRNHIPDIIISDLMMPEMDGLELVKAVRQNTMMNNIPFIMLTAKTREEDNIEGLHAGVDAYITKPFHIEIVRTTALNLVHRHDQLKNIFNGSQTPEVENKVQIQSPDEKLMKRIIKVINDNIANPDLGNDLITREVGISRVHLYRKLKELTNLSLRDYIKNIRLTEAARLLSEQKHNISSVAQSTGFDNVSYFTVVFKQKYGVSPSVYMENQRKKNEEEGSINTDESSADSNEGNEQ